MNLRNWNKIKLMLLVSLLSFAGTSCTHIPDGPGCIELSDRKGWCTHVLSENEFYVDDENLYDGKSWPEVRATSILIPARYWAKLKSELIRSCKKNGNCPSGWEQKLDKLDGQLGEHFGN